MFSRDRAVSSQRFADPAATSPACDPGIVLAPIWVVDVLEVPFWSWLVFAGIVLASLALDLLSHRGGRGSSRRAAIVWSVVWIVIALGFGIGVALMFGRDAGEDFLTAYLIEKSLSIDNLFVFLVVFSRLGIPDAEQHRVLFWGILGALIARAIFVVTGTAVLLRWHEVVYALGAFLIYTGWKTARAHDGEDGHGRLLAFVRRRVPLATRSHDHRFIAVEDGRRVGTPLLLALIVIEITDVLFAIDSVPAVFAVSQDPFIVYTSNVFAILGLRALYLVLAGLLRDLAYLRYALAAILMLAGVKMLVSDHVHVPHAISLGAIVVILTAAVVPSLIVRHRRARPSR
jgi:tellurite resistance protein TerC